MSGRTQTATTAAATVEARPVGELRPHPEAGEVPAMTAAEFASLKADIAEKGIEEALKVTGKGVVLDGHMRLQAARELGLASVPVRVVAPENEAEYMLRAALHRRHLSPSQRAALALKLVPFEQLREDAATRQQANLRQSAEVASLPARGERTRERIAELAGASPRTVQDVITVHDHNPALFESVLLGQVSASTAASKTRRALRDAAIPPPPPLPEGPFGAILADPPWTMGSPDSQFAPEQHYPTMTLDEICAMAIPAADDCVLFLWAVTCLLPAALEVITAWGFTYRSSLVWVKTDGIGPGVWLRQRHEQLLIATRGHIPPPDPEDRVDSVIQAPRGDHSTKPEESYQRIERMYPHLPKLELFRRGQPRPGWHAWGNQTTPPDHTGEKSS
jgi:N6-adenosine-specific RNA methylase IME4